MKLRWKIQAALLLIALLPFLIAGVFGYTKARQVLEERFLSHLESVASIQAERVEGIFAQNQERLHLISSRTQMRLSLAEFLESGSQEDEEKLRRIVSDACDSMDELRHLTIRDLEGSVVLSTKTQAEPRLPRNPARSDTVDFFKTETGELGLLSHGPLLLDGKRIGTIEMETGATGLAAVTKSYEGLGKTGETILAKADGQDGIVYLTPLRFDPSSQLSPYALTEAEKPIFAAVSQEEKLFTRGRDYRGEKVLSVTRYVESADIGLEVKVDRVEALLPILQLRRMTIASALVTFGLVAAISWFLANSILRPIEQLTRSAHIIESGEYQHRAKVDGKDEIADLADAFNLMAQQLTAANRNLEEKIAKRTEQLERSKERFELAVSGSAAGIWDWDLASDQIFFSDRFKELLGYQPTEFDDSFEAWERRIHPDEREPVIAALRQHLNNGHSVGKDMFDQEFRIQRRDGNYRWFHTRGQAVREASRDAPSRMAGSITDIHSKKQYEARLEHSVRELEQFAYVASHDLREPLRMVASYVKLLERRYADKLDESAKDFINYAVDGANRMQKLIEDLLTYSRVGSKPQDLQPIHAEQALSEAMINLQEAIRETNAEVTHDPLPMVSADQTQLIQLLQNLIANAIKFSSGGQIAKVHLSAKPLDGKWCFSVRDNGIGIKKQYQERIFKIFQRLHSRDDFEGTGIGLAVVHKIIERHGGSVWLESEEGEGTTFFFTLHRPLSN